MMAMTSTSARPAMFCSGTMGAILRRGGAGMRSAELMATDAAKVAAIADAQASGAVSTRFAPGETLAIVTVLSSILPVLLEGASDARVREVVTTAVARLLS